MKRIKLIVQSTSRMDIVRGGHHSSNGYCYNWESSKKYDVLVDIDGLEVTKDDVKAIERIYPKEEYDSGCDWGISGYSDCKGVDEAKTEDVCQRLNAYFGERSGIHFDVGCQKECRYYIKSVLFADTIRFSKGKLEAYAKHLNELDLEPIKNVNTKYIIDGTVNENNGNLNYIVKVREVRTESNVKQSRWTLKEIYFQQNWSELSTPQVIVIDPYGDEFCPRIPFVLQQDISPIPNREVSAADKIRRIKEGIDIFIETASYRNKKHYLTINEYVSSSTNGVLDIDLEKWGRRFLEIHSNDKMYSDKQKQSFFGLYAKELDLYFKFK